MIRRANIADLGEIAALARLLDPPWTDGMTADVIKKPTADVAVYDDGGISAFICAEYILDEGCITGIAVLPGARRQGVASGLICFVERLREKRNIYLEVNENNIPAVRLYEKHGYIQTGKRKNYYGKDAAIIMNKEF